MNLKQFFCFHSFFAVDSIRNKNIALDLDNEYPGLFRWFENIFIETSNISFIKVCHRCGKIEDGTIPTKEKLVREFLKHMKEQENYERAHKLYSERKSVK